MKKILLVVVVTLLGLQYIKAAEMTSMSQTETNSQTQSAVNEKERKITKTVQVKAAVYYFVDNFNGTYNLKDVNRVETITVNIYDDGTMYVSGLFSPVRWSTLSYYTYEANDGNKFWFFDL